MRRVLFVVVACLSVVACKKTETTPPPAASSSNTASSADTAAADALWKIGPPVFESGAVITPRGVAHIEGASLQIQAVLKARPELAQLAGPTFARMFDNGFDPLTSFADQGIDVTKGFASFTTKQGRVLVLPIGDRAKLAKKQPALGTDPSKLGDMACKTLGTSYVCADSDALLATLSKGAVPTEISRIGARGDIELVVPGPKPIAAVIQLQRGQAVVRGHAQAPPMLVGVVGTPVTPSIEPASDANFVVVAPPKSVDFVPELPLPTGVTLRALAATVSGPIQLHTTAGTTVPQLRIPLSDPKPFSDLVARCNELVPPHMLATTQPAGGGCGLSLPQYAIDVELWVTGNELRGGIKAAAPTGKKVAMSPLGLELAKTAWGIGFWGRGTALGTPLPPGSPPEALAIMRTLSTLNEIGLGLKLDNDTIVFHIVARTAFSNPPEVVTRLLALSDAQLGDKAAFAALTKGFPGAPLAADIESGHGGLIIPTAFVGMFAAVAVPAFMDYMKKSKKSEAPTQLERIAELAEQHYLAKGAYPKGSTPVTPSTSCCKSTNKRCASTAPDWTGPLKDMGFSIDQPHLFRYSYRSDGTTFTAKAHGDLDCDETEVAWTMEGRVDGGKPAHELVPPPPNAD